MTHASLFSGIGGPEVAAAMLGWTNVFHCEINKFSREILEYWFPESESYEDIKKTEFTRYRGQIDVLTGGFPCQPFSYAGKRGGQTDDRYLWPEMLRVIEEIRPTWVVGENVAGITTMVESDAVTDLGCYPSLFEEDNGVHRYRDEQTFTIERICKDLESKGYSVQPLLIPAAAVGAPHRRDRIFIIAHITDSDSSNDLRKSREDESESGKERLSEWNEVRKPGESDILRLEMSESIENPMFNGRKCRQKKEQKCEWDIGNISPGNSERIYREERLDASDSECLRLQHDMVGRSESGMFDAQSGRREKGISQQVQFVEAIGKGESIADTDCNRGRKVHQYIQSSESDGEESVGNGRFGDASDTISKRLERQNESWSGEGRQRVQVRRYIAGCDMENVKDQSHAHVQHHALDGIIGYGCSSLVTNSNVNGYSSSEEDRNIESDRCENNGEQELRRIKAKWDNGLFTFPQFSPDSDSRRYSRSKTEKRKGINVMWGNRESLQRYQARERWADFPTVSPVHRGNDGLPFNVDDLTISFAKWRTESIKAYGNAIVPQVMYEIFRAIEEIESI